MTALIQRWVPAGSMLAVSLISYIDRNALAIVLLLCAATLTAFG